MAIMVIIDKDHQDHDHEFGEWSGMVNEYPAAFCECGSLKLDVPDDEVFDVARWVQEEQRRFEDKERSDG